MRLIEIGLLLPLLLAAGIAAHAGLSRVLKTVLWSWSPLATGEPEAAVYERRVYHTASRAMRQVIGTAAASGAVAWALVASGHGAWWPAALLLLAAALGLDLLRWERVAVSGNHLWFQRGWGGRVHQVAMENIRDLSVEQSEGRGPTLRRARGSRLVRLKVRMQDKRVVALPKTDAAGGVEAVSRVADHLRLRLSQLRGRAGGRPGLRPEATAVAPSELAAKDDELRIALLRLRHSTAAQRRARSG